MLAELFPFWTKYGYCIIIVLVFYSIVNLVSKYKASYCESGRNENNNYLTEYGKEFEDEPALSINLQHIPYDYKKPTADQLEKRAAEFYKIANARRTIRFFSSESVPRRVIYDIIKSAGMCLYL